ncbi:MAG: FAD-dependent oxidoreductase [Phycicoccus sp.]|uniref:FAD-dependent oxidoreductase n=1 Tax=Phycicoccus sp. TaxID=1902410 RepID=UPI0025862FF8|nr:FAD-dependent oxidoreductase [Phycicoccus sp.]MCO5303579.1 FAD-dependent oxidoreductase [Phycicoccus sp.]
MDIIVIGSGPTGLLTGAALAQRGHRVVSVDRDPGPAADGSWARRGVMQFEHAHGFRPQVGDVLAKRWPAGLEAWLEAGADPVEITLPDGTTVPIGHRSLRSTFERGLRAAALRTPGLELRAGHVDVLLTTDDQVADDQVTGIVIDGEPMRADLVVDASGRSGRPDRCAPDPTLIGSCGMAYVDRVYRLHPDAEPGPLDGPVAAVNDYDGYQILVFLHHAGYFSVLIVEPLADHELKVLRHRPAFEAACRAIPTLAAWTDPERAEPVTGVLVGGALRNTYRPQRLLRGLVTVGDAVATTTPTRGRGLALAYTQVDALLELLDDGSPDARAVAEPFDAWCDTWIRPWVDDHLAVDDELVERWQGADLDLTRPLTSNSICTAAQVDPRIDEIAGPFYLMTALPACLEPAEPLARAAYDSGWRPPYAAGPGRDDLVEMLAAVAV